MIFKATGIRISNHIFMDMYSIWSGYW
jgi:hypothetical protein